MGNERRRIQNPGVRNELPQPMEEAFAQFLPPKAVKISIPQQRKEHLFFKNHLRWRGQKNVLLASEGEDLLPVGHIRQIEHLEEAIHRIAFGKISEAGILNFES